jgi:UDP-glucuronate 4-epimerase
VAWRPCSSEDFPVRILITGAAGFIGYHVCKRLEGHEIIALDNFNNYYDVSLKREREKLLPVPVVDMDINNISEMDLTGVDLVIHLAAQAGVRYSIENPQEYFRTNVKRFFNILEACRHNKIPRLFYASSSSVYGNNKIPFSENDKTDSPLSFYAATKKANEVMAKAYSEIYGIETTGLRFFTVYGEWGRPDMAVYKFTDSVRRGVPVHLHNAGEMERDFTYIDDVVECIYKLIKSSQNETAEIYNIGKGKSNTLKELLSEIEEGVGREAITVNFSEQVGDALRTCANVRKLKSRIKYVPQTDIKAGIKRYIEWHKKYYKST